MKPTLIMTLLASAGLAQAAFAEAPKDENVFVVRTNDADTATCNCACCAGAMSDEADHVKMMKLHLTPGGGAEGGHAAAHAFTITIDDDGKVSFHSAKLGDAPHAQGHTMGSGFTFDSDHMNWKSLAESLGRMGGNSFSFGGNDDDDDDAPHVVFFQGENEQAGDDDDDNDRPRLGVMLEQEDNGLEIAELIDGMPAARSGLKEGDVIVRINGDDDANLDELREALDASKIKLDVDRDGAAYAFVIDLDEDVAPSAYDDDGDASRERRIVLRKMMQENIDHDGAHGHGGADRDDKNFDFDFDGDMMEQIHNAILKALSSQSLHIDGNAKEALVKALGAMGQSKGSKSKEGGRMRFELRPDQKPHGARGDVEERIRATFDRARTRAGSDRQRVKEVIQKAREKATDARNPEVGKRLKSLEERMERIEVLLEKLAQHG